MKFVLVATVIAVFFVSLLRLRKAMFVPMLMLASWTPALLVSSLPFEFTSGTYSILNRGVSSIAYFAFVAMFFSVAVGSFLAYRTLPVSQDRVPFPQFNTYGLWLLFVVGLFVYVVAYARSGLASTLSGQGDPMAVLAHRKEFYLGSVNHLILVMDIASIVFFTTYLYTRRPLYILPAVVTLAAYFLTYQKSHVISIVISLVFVGSLYANAARQAFLGSAFRRAATLGFSVLVSVGMIWTNARRGMSEIDVMAFSPIQEQLFIYSGAPALLNISATLEGVRPSGEAQMGLTLFRSLIWSFADRSLLNPTQYLEGINNGTILVFWWHDFRWAGVLIIPFLFGFLTTRMIASARSGRIFPIVAGTIACFAVVMSVYTDVISEATTLISLVLAFLIDRGLGRRRAAQGLS